LIIYKSTGVIVANSSKQDGNMALHTGDDIEHVVANRIAFLNKLDISPNGVVCMDQIHSDTVMTVSTEDAGRGFYSHENSISACDAIVTSCKGLTLSVMTADCVPVLLWDEQSSVIAAAHAGWKGTAKNIVQKTVSAMVELGASVQNIHAYIGPSIGECCYEVGADTANACGCHGKTSLELKEINRAQLLTSGINEQNIEQSHLCTSCDNEHFFSYRRENGCKGRFMSVISLTKPS